MRAQEGAQGHVRVAVRQLEMGPVLGSRPLMGTRTNHLVMLPQSRGRSIQLSASPHWLMLHTLRCAGGGACKACVARAVGQLKVKSRLRTKQAAAGLQQIILGLGEKGGPTEIHRFGRGITEDYGIEAGGAKAACSARGEEWGVGVDALLRVQGASLGSAHHVGRCSNLPRAPAFHAQAPPQAGTMPRTRRQEPGCCLRRSRPRTPGRPPGASCSSSGTS